MKKVLIRTGYGCNNDCEFCHLGIKNNTNLTTKQIEEKIVFAKKKGYNFVVLSGGEPTIRKDIISISNFIKKNGMYLGILTNGRMFSYDLFLKKLIKNDLRYIYISLLGSTESVHNSIIRAKGFNQTIKGIKNILKYNDVECKVNVTVVSKNINDLKNIVDMAEDIGIKKLKFSSVDCKGKVLENIEMVPKLSKTVKKIKEAIDYVSDKNIDICISDFPLCLIKGYEKYIDNLETNEILAMTEIFEDKIFPIDNDDKDKPDSCLGCECYSKCKGVDIEYLKINGDNEILDSRKIGNSFLFTAKNTIEYFDCTNLIKDKNEIVVKGTRYKLYKSNNNFNDKEIELLKKKEQIYLINEQSEQNILDQLIKLEEDDKCKICDNREDCSRVFVSQKNNPFVKYINSVKNELNKLKGRVLDVGCGNMFFEDIFSRLIRNGKINYTGIDPEHVVNSKYKIIISEFEKYKFDNGYFDNILLLGSYNHILNLEILFSKIGKELKKGGLLIITDSEPYIILKDRITEKKKHNFEHYRNASSLDVIKKLKSNNFKIIKEVSVNKDSCNQWMVVAMKGERRDA